MSALLRFGAFYAALFAAFGAASPFLPGLLQQDGLAPGQLSLVLAAGTAIRLAAGPGGGRLADRSGRAPWVLAGFTAAAALVAGLYLPARGLALLLLVSVLHASLLAPITPVADALALGSSQGQGGFQYGWVRGAGSAAFILGTLVAGKLVGPMGNGVIVWLNLALLAAAACIALLLPNRVAGTKAPAAGSGPADGLLTLLHIPLFVRLMTVAALITGSHALHDTFEVIRWRAAGLSAEQSSILWSLSVAAEVVMFVLIGPRLLQWLGPSRAMMLAAAAGIIRWSTAAVTAAFPAMMLVEPLHGLTFALLHLACLDVIMRVVPAALAATAQAIYGTFAVGAAAAAVTLVSGPLYASFGAGAFWAMACLCAVAMPVALSLREAGKDGAAQGVRP